MTGLRSFFRRHHSLAAAIVAMALCLKVLVPSGYMPEFGGRTITMEVCADATGEHRSRTIVIPSAGTSGDHKGEHTGAGDCPYAGLGLLFLAGADPVQLTLALAFAIILGFTPRVPLRPCVPARLRPPLRGPPLPT